MDGDPVVRVPSETLGIERKFPTGRHPTFNSKATIVFVVLRSICILAEPTNRIVPCAQPILTRKCIGSRFSGLQIVSRVVVGHPTLSLGVKRRVI